MKVFIAGDKSLADLVRRLGKGFQALGHKSEIFYLNQPSILERWGYRLERLPAAKLRTLGGSLRDKYLREVNALFLKSASAFRPDLVFVIQGVQLLVEALAIFRREVTCPIANWLVDDPSRAYDGRSLVGYPLYDVLFTCETEWLEFCKLWGSRISYLQTAADPLEYRLLPGDVSEETDIVFVGSFLPNEPSSFFRASILHSLANRNYTVKIYGHGISHFFKSFPDLRKFQIVEKVLPVGEVNKIYNRAKVVLNIHSLSIRYGISPRVFEAASAGAFQLVDYRRDFDRLFPQGLIVTYRTVPDMLDKADFYLKNHDERKKKAKAASDYVRRHHTYTQRAKAILDKMAS